MNEEITIEVRDNGVSITGPGVGNDTDAVRETLQAALNALDSDRERETYTNEIVVKND